MNISHTETTLSRLATMSGQMLGSLMLCSAIAFHIGRNHFEVITPLTDWFLNRDEAKWPFYAVTAFTGVLFMTAGRRGSQVAELTAKYGPGMAQIYAGAGGALLGWVSGIAAAALCEDFAQYWSFAVIITGMAFCVAAIPWFGLTVTQATVEDFNRRLFRPLWREHGQRLIGLALLALSIFWSLIDQMRA